MQNKIIGITAEYNPFHKGHLYQLETLKNQHPGAGIIAVLSSDFLQRGIPALVDKWERSRMAVKSGVNLVLELPFPFACNNAGVFAAGSIAIMKGTGIVTSVSFGMEDIPEEDMLSAIPAILVQERPPFKALLQNFLKKGLSYAQARSEAVDVLCPGGGLLLEKPNNTLAFAYAEAILRLNAGFSLLPVTRKGAGYHNADMGEIMSASGLRKLLQEGETGKFFKSVPSVTAEAVTRCIKEKRLFTDTGKFWNFLRFLLMRSTPETLSQHADFIEGIENRYLSRYGKCDSYESLVGEISTRRYPGTRIRRQLAALFTGFTQEENILFQKNGPAYIRPLAMDSHGREMLRAIKKHGTLPIADRPAALKNNPYAQHIFALEYRASRLYETLLEGGDMERELKMIPYRL